MKGFYCITNLINGMSYVGQSKRVEQRVKEHFNCKPTPNLDRFHYDILTLGRENFEFEYIQCICSSWTNKQMLARESFWIQHYDTFENGYNKTYYDEDGHIHFKEQDVTNYYELYMNRFNLEYYNNKYNN